MKRGELIKSKIKEIWIQFKSTKIGLVGIALLIVLVIMAIIPWFTLDPVTFYRWRYNQYWDLNPELAPPEWINLFVSKKYTPHRVLSPVKVEPSPYGRGYVYIFVYDYKWDIPTKDIVILIENVNTTVNVMLDVVRPSEPGVSEEDRHLYGVLYEEGLEPVDGKVLVRLGGEVERNQILKNLIMYFVAKYDKTADINKLLSELASLDPFVIMFSSAGPGMAYGRTSPLRGEYEFYVYVHGDISRPPTVKLVIVGSCYGLLGTDNKGRDIFVGILWGTHIALIMGLAYAFAVTLIGVIYGSISGYFGGKLDAVMQRIVEIMYSIPGFAFVILLVYMFREIYGQVNIWIIIGVYIIFGWPYISMVIRSMVMQIRAQPYIEAVKAIGASNLRILFLHVVPQVIPYSFAMMILTIPNAIMIEAALNVLGLGNPWIPTWGRLLASAIDEGVVTAWWWYIPPGAMIALTGITFIFIGNALETIVNPRLRKA